MRQEICMHVCMYGGISKGDEKKERKKRGENLNLGGGEEHDGFFMNEICMKKNEM